MKVKRKCDIMNNIDFLFTIDICENNLKTRSGKRRVQDCGGSVVPKETSCGLSWVRRTNCNSNNDCFFLFFSCCWSLESDSRGRNSEACCDFADWLLHCCNNRRLALIFFRFQRKSHGFLEEGQRCRLELVVFSDRCCSIQPADRFLKTFICSLYCQCRNFHSEAEDNLKSVFLLFFVVSKSANLICPLSCLPPVPVTTYVHSSTVALGRSNWNWSFIVATVAALPCSVLTGYFM